MAKMCVGPGRFWRAETGIFLALWFGILIAGRTRLFGDPGTFWHVVVGRSILANGELIHSDPFSFTCQGRPWIAQQWLGECTMAVLHDQVGGLDGLLLGTATLLACLFTFLAHRLIRGGVGWPLAILLTMLALLASSYHLHPRPHLANIVLLAATFAVLCDFEAGRIPLSRLFWLVPLFVLWTNIHGGMVGGVVTLALVAAGWGLAYLLRQSSPLTGYRQMLLLAFLGVACGLTMFVNPYGLEMPRVWFSLMQSPVLPRLMIEHAPLRDSGRSGWAVLAFGLVYLVALLGVLPSRPRVTWLLPLAWLYLAWTRIRHGPLFAVTAAIALADMFPHIRWVSWLSRNGSHVFRIQPAVEGGRGREPDWRPAVLPVVLVLAMVLLQASSPPVTGGESSWVKLEPSHWPVELLPQLRAYEQSRPKGTPVFNEMLFSGFLMYHTPGLLVFIDDRCELYGDEGLLAYAGALEEDPSQIERWAEQYQFDTALVTPGSGFDSYLRTARGWKLVSGTAAANLYSRKHV